MKGYGIDSGPGWAVVQAEFESGSPWTELGIVLPFAAPLVIVCTVLGIGLASF